MGYCGKKFLREFLQGIGISPLEEKGTYARESGVEWWTVSGVRAQCVNGNVIDVITVDGDGIEDSSFRRTVYAKKNGEWIKCYEQIGDEISVLEQV